MKRWVKIWAPIIMAIGMGLVYTIMPSFFSDMSIWILLLLLSFGVSLILVSIYMLLHGLIDKCYEEKKSWLLVVIILIIGFVFGGSITFLFYKNKIEKLEKSILTPKQIESNVRNWLEEYGYSVLKKLDEKEHFRFIASNKTGDNIVIRLPKLQENRLLLQLDIIPTDDEQDAIKKLDLVGLDKLLVDIKWTLIAIGLRSFEVRSELKIIELREFIFAEALTKTTLSDALIRLKSARVMIYTFFFTISQNN